MHGETVKFVTSTVCFDIIKNTSTKKWYTFLCHRPKRNVWDIIKCGILNYMTQRNIQNPPDASFSHNAFCDSS